MPRTYTTTGIVRPRFSNIKKRLYGNASKSLNNMRKNSRQKAKNRLNETIKLYVEKITEELKKYGYLIMGEYNFIINQRKENIKLTYLKDLCSILNRLNLTEENFIILSGGIDKDSCKLYSSNNDSFNHLDHLEIFTESPSWQIANNLIKNANKGVVSKATEDLDTSKGRKQQAILNAVNRLSNSAQIRYTRLFGKKRKSKKRSKKKKGMSRKRTSRKRTSK